MNRLVSLPGGFALGGLTMLTANEKDDSHRFNSPIAFDSPMCLLANASGWQLMKRTEND